MRNNYTVLFAGVAALVAVAVAPSLASAQCGDVNNDGAVNGSDVSCLSAILAAVSPLPATCNPGTVCTPAADCDLFRDNVQSNADLSVLQAVVNGRQTLHDPCVSVGTQIACGGAADSETGLPTATVGNAPNDQTIAASQIWPNTCTIILNDTVFVSTPPGGPTTVLTIQPGTVVKGLDTATPPGEIPALIFLSGSRISAIGTPAVPAPPAQQGPIVFTSTAADGTKSKGDWAGVMFNGRSTVNRSSVGPCLNEAEGIPEPYGGCIANDSSGIAQFVRVEYAGLDFTPNNELNLWTMNALGTGTSFRFIEAHAGDDDCIEWFGGTIVSDHFVASACGDDGFDWQLGFTGGLQYGLMVQNGQLTDDPTAGNSRGIEADNSEFDHNASPRSNPDMCNLTLIGAKDQPGINGGSDVGMLLRRGTQGTIANTLTCGWLDAGVELNDTATFSQAMNPGPALDTGLRIRNSYFADNGSANAEHCKRPQNCVNGAGQTQATAECTAAGVPLACCTGLGTGNCLPCDRNANCVTAPYNTCGGLEGSTCNWYDLLNASQDVDEPDGTAGACPVTTLLPAGDDLFHCTPGSVVATPAANCATINEVFQNTNYLGACNPAAEATCDVVNGPCDWLSKPWLNFNATSNQYP